MTLNSYKRMRFGGRIPYQEITHQKYVITAKDDNGNTIVATGKLIFHQK